MIKTKRKLTPEELILSTKSVNRIKEKLAYNEYQLQICNLKLDSGLMVEHLKQIRDYNKLRKEFSGQAMMNKDTLKTLQEQIRVGVDIIENDKDNKVFNTDNSESEKEVNDNGKRL